MVDREARGRMAKAIRSYMGEKITAFQFDDALTETTSTTADSTVQAIRSDLWFHYDDLKDHKIVASKEQWDYFNRLLLLLESDAEMETGRSTLQWHPFQAIAALLLLLFLIIVFQTGFGEHLFAYALPFGPPSMLLAWLNSRRQRKTTSTREIALKPFPRVRSLLAVRRRVGGFSRRRYPEAIASRKVRDPIINKLMWIPWSIAWCMFSPIALFFQMLPTKRRETRITIPKPQPC
jgi:hypothetical protein